MSRAKSTVPIVSYEADVSVTTTADGRHAVISDFVRLPTGGEDPASEPVPTVEVPHGQGAQLHFLLVTEGYRYADIAPRVYGEEIGPLRIGFHAESPEEQHRFGFSLPPVRRAEIRDDRRRISLEVVNTYDHQEKFLYEVLVAVQDDVGNVLEARAVDPADPTIIEDSDPPPQR